VGPAVASGRCRTGMTGSEWNSAGDADGADPAVPPPLLRNM